MGQARPGLACVVVKLHEAEDQVGGHQLELVRRVRDHVPAEQPWENDVVGGGGSKSNTDRQNVQRSSLSKLGCEVPFCTRAWSTEMSIS